MEPEDSFELNILKKGKSYINFFGTDLPNFNAVLNLIFIHYYEKARN